MIPGLDIPANNRSANLYEAFEQDAIMIVEAESLRTPRAESL